MTRIKRFSSALFAALCLFAPSARAQTPSVSTVNLAPDAEKVRVSSVGDVFDMRVAVSDEAGDVVFEGGAAAGDHLDWAMSDAQGRRVPAGAYTMTVTYRASNGKLKRRVEQVFVSEEVKGGVEAQAASSPAAQDVAAFTGQGTSGKIAKFTGASSVGNSVLTESAGRIGLGTAAPAQSLHVVGTSSQLRLQSAGASALTATEYVSNSGRVWQAGAGGPTAAGGVANKFFVYDQTANNYRLVIDTAGNFGLGTAAPTARLTVNGGIQILGAGNGIRFADGSIQTKATPGTITGTGAANRLAKFTGPNSFGNSSITETGDGKVGIGTTAPDVTLTVIDGGSGTAVRGVASGGGVVGEASIGYGLIGKGGIAGVHGSSTGGYGVYGFSDTNSGVYGATDTGYAGYFAGRATVEGNFVVGGNQSFGSQTRQMLNLWGTNYGIGVQDSAQYYRTDFNFNWYKGGVHNDQDTNAGGGVLVMRLDSSGNLTTKGTVNGASDRNLKSNFASVNPRLILDRLAAVPVHTWNYKGEPAAVRHIGPTAQDFSAAFNVGADDRHISMVDADGVTMASIQALYQMAQEAGRQNQELNRKVERLQAQLHRIRLALRRGRSPKR